MTGAEKSEAREFVKEILPGVFQIQLHSSLKGISEIKVYLIPGQDRSLLIDTGFRDRECQNRLEQAMDSLGISAEKLDVSLTHKHHDHCGLAYILAERGARIFLSPVEERHRYDCLHYSHGESDDQDEVLRYVGITAEGTSRLWNMFKDLVIADKEGELLIEKFPYSPVLPGDVFRYGQYRFRAVSLSGHTLGQTGLYEEDKQILFTADQVLNGIVPIVATSYKDENLLNRYFQSLKEIKELYSDCTLIPAHSKVPVENPAKTIDHIVFSYLEKINIMKQILDHARNPMTVRQVASIAYGMEKIPENLDQLMKLKMVISKTFSCLEFLYEQDFAVRTERDGTLYWESP